MSTNDFINGIGARKILKKRKRLVNHELINDKLYITMLRKEKQGLLHGNLHDSRNVGLKTMETIAVWIDSLPGNIFRLLTYITDQIMWPASVRWYGARQNRRKQSL